MLRSITTAAALVFAASTASAATLESFELDVTTAAGTDSSVVLALGETYRLTVSGTFFLGTNQSRHLADAEYFNLASTPFVPLDGTSLEIGVGVDGTDIDFGAYQASNVYSTLLTGTGSTINVFFSDSDYRDNVGSLSVDIASVPIPAGAGLLLSALGGLAFARRRAA